MNKVVNINLNGLVFSIDETAYEQLKAYLDGLKRHFSGTEGASEIITDIEARIAELLQARLNERYTVIQLTDVQDVIALMGDPRQIDGQEEQVHEPREEKQYKTGEPKKLRRDQNQKVLGGVCAGIANYFGIDIMIPRILFLVALFVFGTGVLAYIVLWIAIPQGSPHNPDEAGLPHAKRLFRDSEDKTIGGVCSGIAQYIGIDTVWLRIAFLIAFFVFGSGLLIYLILWIAIPLAKTSVEKLQMKGESIDVSNIEKVVRNTMDKSSVRLKKETDSLASGVRNSSGALSEIARMVVKLITKMTGAFLIILAIVVAGVVIFLWNYSFAELLRKMDVTTFFSYFQYGVGLFSFSLASLFLLLGVKLAFYRKLSIKVAVIILFTTMLVGIGLILYFGLRYKASVAQKETVKQQVIAAHCPDTLYIQANHPLDEDDTEQIHVRINNKRKQFKMTYAEDLSKLFYNTKLIIKSSNTDSLLLSLVKTARGESDEAAFQNAKDIPFHADLHNNILMLDPGVLLEKGQPFKFQQVKVRLKVPVGTIIIVDRQVMKMVNSSYEEDFDLGETFKMTPNGLHCLDCTDIEDDEEETNIEWNIDEEKGEFNIHINKDEKDQQDSANSAAIKTENKAEKSNKHTIHIKKIKKQEEDK